MQLSESSKRFLYRVKVYEADSKIHIKRLMFKTFVKDLKKVFGDTSVGIVFRFYISNQHFLGNIFHIEVDSFFGLEMIYLFSKLYEATKRNDYYQVVELLVSNTHLSKLESETDYDISRINELKLNLKSFQKEFVKRYFDIKHKLSLNGMFLSFDQGLGKTPTSLAIAHIIGRQTIIFCEKSHVEKWKLEVQKFIPGNPRIIIVGTGNIKYADYDFIIANYERASSVKELASRDPMIIIDESHNLRNEGTKRVSEVTDIVNYTGSINVLALSGTPMKGFAVELMPILNVIDPKFNESAREVFKKIYNKYSNVAHAMLKYKFTYYMYRKLKHEVIDLPEKQHHLVYLKVPDSEKYHISYIKEKLVERSMEYYNLYAKDREQHETDLLAIFENLHKKGYVSKPEIGIIRSVIGKYGKSSFEKYAEDYEKFKKIYDRCYSYLTRHDMETRILMADLKSKTVGMRSKAFGKAMGEIFIKSKIQCITDIMQNNRDEIGKIISSSEKKVLVFSNYIHNVNMFIKLFKKFDPIPITGESGNVQQIIDQFTDSPTSDVLIASIKKLATGVDVLAASSVIFLDDPYRDADKQQAQDRVHRIGQDTPVHVFSIYLDTGKEPNITTHALDIVNWSKAMFDSVITKE